MISGDKDSFAGDAVHIDADASFEIVEMNETIFCNEEDDAIAGRNLHCNREIVRSFRREEDIDGFLWKLGVSWVMINLDNMQLYC